MCVLVCFLYILFLSLCIKLSKTVTDWVDCSLSNFIVVHYYLVVYEIIQFYLTWWIYHQCILHGDTEYFDIVAGVLQGDTLAPYLFIICLDYVLRTSIDKIKENGFELTKKRSRRYPATTITDADYADDIAILANTPDQAETLLHSLERAAASIGLHVNAHKTEYMCYNQTGDISTLEGTPLKLVDKFTYLGSSVESTEKDIETRLTKAWTAINRLSTIWKSDLTDKMKRSFFQAAVTSILLYGCTTWTLTKRLEKKLDGNYTRMLRAILNKSWQQHPTRHQLYGHLPPITKSIQVRRTRHAGHCWRSRDELIRDVLLWIPTHGRAKAGRPARTYIQQLCEDTGCCPEDLPRAMNDREEWRERVRDIRAASTIWWWWWSCIKAAVIINFLPDICFFFKFVNVDGCVWTWINGVHGVSFSMYEVPTVKVKFIWYPCMLHNCQYYFCGRFIFFIVLLFITFYWAKFPRSISVANQNIVSWYHWIRLTQSSIFFLRINIPEKNVEIFQEFSCCYKQLYSIWSYLYHWYICFKSVIFLIGADSKQAGRTFNIIFSAVHSQENVQNTVFIAVFTDFRKLYTVNRKWL